jgi:predicted nucleic acid-binding protein
MIATAFVDTNVLIYAATGRRSEPAKYAVARDLIATTRLGLSGQVVAEFVANVRNERKMRHPLSFEETLGWVERLEAFPFVDVDRVLVRAGVVLAERFRISYWDAAILAAAERLAAPILYSEDLNHGQSYGSVRVINPFLSA